MRPLITLSFSTRWATLTMLKRTFKILLFQNKRIFSNISTLPTRWILDSRQNIYSFEKCCFRRHRSSFLNVEAFGQAFSEKPLKTLSAEFRADFSLNSRMRYSTFLLFFRASKVLISIFLFKLAYNCC
jgi:hypothetical protein